VGIVLLHLHLSFLLLLFVPEEIHLAAVSERHVLLLLVQDHLPIQGLELFFPTLLLGVIQQAHFSMLVCVFQYLSILAARLLAGTVHLNDVVP